LQKTVLRVYGGTYWYGYHEVDVVGKVAYSEKASTFVLISKDAEYLLELILDGNNFEIIGNIYKNPELKRMFF